MSGRWVGGRSVVTVWCLQHLPAHQQMINLLAPPVPSATPAACGSDFILLLAVWLLSLRAFSVLLLLVCKMYTCKGHAVHRCSGANSAGVWMCSLMLSGQCSRHATRPAAGTMHRPAAASRCAAAAAVAQGLPFLWRCSQVLLERQSIASGALKRQGGRMGEGEPSSAAERVLANEHLLQRVLSHVPMDDM